MIYTKKLLNDLVGIAKWSPLILPYHAAVLLGLPVSIQIALMPPTRKPLIVKIWLDAIELETRKKHRFPHLRFVWPGDWDRNFTRPLCTLEGPNDPASPFAQDFATVRQLCREHEAFDRLEEYRGMMEALCRGGHPRGCKTQSDVEGYFVSLVKASKSIRDEGYRTSAELGGLKRDEVSVWIARDGLLVYGGWANHRLAMAMYHNVERIPVSILGAHPDWLHAICREYDLPPHKALQEWAEKFP